jgi:glycosyltransferase involved in cell wall biosynthesis
VRIAYVCFWNAYLLDGVAKKILTQTSHWRRAGHSVEIFCLTPASRTGASPVLPGHVFPFTNLAGRYRATARLAAAARAFEADVLYVRDDLFLPPLWRLAERPGTVLELNTAPEEYDFRGALARRYHDLNRRQLFRRAGGFVSISRGFVESTWLAPYPQPKLVLGNSIDLAAFPETAAPANERPRGLFLGTSGLAWHGVDKVRLLAELLPDFDFDVVGPGEADLGGPAPPNLVVHGYLDREQYEPLARKADFGISSLALHRQGLREMSPLKLREYLAYGLPVVLAHEDPDLADGEHWFVLELPNAESNVTDGVQAVHDFVLATKGRRVDRATVEALVGAPAKEALRLDFMRRVVEGGS